jgi:hypothetical protein
MKRGLLIGGLLALLLMLVVPISPVVAADQVDVVPSFELPQSGRFDVFYGEGETSLLVGSGKFASLTRFYVAYQLQLPNEPLEVGEAVFYDGTLYTRKGDNSQWFVESQDESFPTDAEIRTELASIIGEPITEEEGITLVRLGTETVSGVETTHYQVVIVDEPGKIDIWVGREDTIVYQAQLTAVLDGPGGTTEEGVALIRFYDVNAAGIEVVEPENAFPQSPESDS